MKRIDRPVLQHAAASYQAGKGSRADRTQAAHNLPRDLLINGRPMWSYATDTELVGASARLRLQINYSSVATMRVPAPPSNVTIQLSD